jgi:hypothetical protein
MPPEWLYGPDQERIGWCCWGRLISEELTEDDEKPARTRHRSIDDPWETEDGPTN